MAYLGIDIGGTKTLIVLFDNKGSIIYRQKILTSKNYPKFLEDIKENLEQIKDVSLEACAVAIPGLINKQKDTAVAFGNLPWKNVPIKTDIERIARCSVLIEHDVSLGGLYEARQLTPAEEKVLYITISTGIGVGVIVNNKIDLQMATSEPGQMEISHEGKMQKWESFASGSAIKRNIGKQAKDIHDDHTWSIIAKNISEGLLDVIAIMQPDSIIFGGGVGHYFKNFHAPLSKELKKYDNPLIKIPNLRPAKDPDNSVILGCFELMKDNF